MIFKKIWNKLLLTSYILRCSSFMFHNTFTTMLPLYYQIGLESQIKDKPQKIIIDNIPLCIFKDKITKQIKLVNDACPHRGASLSKGHLSKDGGLRCAYHFIDFYKGCTTNLSNNMKIIDNNIFFSPVVNEVVEPYLPPEHFDNKFRAIQGTRKIKCNINVLLENIIDSLHISYVHTFGSKDSIPQNLILERLSDTSCRQYFNYNPGELSLSSSMQKFNNNKVSSTLKVENEYHLPASVLSRVFINDHDVKTVQVNAYPQDDSTCIIHWKLYRNYYTYKNEYLNMIIDKLFVFLFEFTLQEDINLLKNVYYEHRLGQFNTKYDKIQLEFRNDIANYHEKKKLL